MDGLGAKEAWPIDVKDYTIITNQGVSSFHGYLCPGLEGTEAAGPPRLDVPGSGHGIQAGTASLQPSCCLKGLFRVTSCSKGRATGASRAGHVLAAKRCDIDLKPLFHCESAIYADVEWGNVKAAGHQHGWIFTVPARGGWGSSGRHERGDRETCKNTIHQMTLSDVLRLRHSHCARN